MAASEPEYLLVTVTGGMCLEQRSNGSYTVAFADQKQHKWTIERGDSEQIAFRSVANKQYLRAVAGGRNASIKTGEKQWWVLEKGNTPGSFWIRCKDYPNAYLCNSWGNYKPNNLVYIWTPDRNWTHSMLWYLIDAKASKSTFGSAPSADVEKQKAELAAKEKALTEREKKLPDDEDKEKQLVEREKKVREAERQAASVKQRTDELEAKEKAFAEKESKQRAELEQKVKDLTEKEAKTKAALEEKEKALSGKGNKIKSRDEDIPGKQSPSAGADRSAELDKKSGEIKTRELLLKQQEEDIRRRTDDLQRRGREIENEKNNIGSATSDSKNAQNSSDGSARSNEEIVRLRQQVQDLEAQIARGRSVSESSRKIGLRPIAMPHEFSYLPRMLAPRNT